MSINKIVGLSSLVLVIGAAGSGLYLSGPPGEQRLVRQDQQRVSDLINISGYISNYRHRHKTMPESTAVILDGRVARRIPVDPVTEASYHFEITEGNNYKLCAEFARVSQKHQAGDFWHHDSGLHCFELSAASK